MHIKQGIMIDEIRSDGAVIISYYNEGKQIWRQQLAQTFRDYLAPQYQQDIDNGDVEKGFQPEKAFAKLKLSKAIDKEIIIA